MAHRPAIAGVLFDSGDVLMRPLGGRWWPKPGFEEALAEHGLAPPANLAPALAEVEALVAGRVESPP